MVDETRLALSIRIPTKAKGFQLNFLIKNFIRASVSSLTWDAEESRANWPQCISNLAPGWSSYLYQIKPQMTIILLFSVTATSYSSLFKGLKRGSKRGRRESVTVNWLWNKVQDLDGRNIQINSCYCRSISLVVMSDLLRSLLNHHGVHSLNNYLLNPYYQNLDWESNHG